MTDNGNAGKVRGFTTKILAPPNATLDLASMPEGQTYEDRYHGYLKIFEQIARLPGGSKIVVKNPPWCWVPLLLHLNCEVEEPRFIFKHCPMVAGAVRQSPYPVLDRTSIEVLCSFRPETADALWKVDMQWGVDHGRVKVTPDVVNEDEFIVTTNGSFHRPEVLEYMGHLQAFKPIKRKVVLVPCAADKPYPALLHTAVRQRMPSDWYMANATGVVGLVPDALWDEMPHYDSGIPNEWRLYQVVKDYFTRNPHDEIVVYCDFYSIAIHDALKAIGHDRVQFVLPVKRYDDYVDLLSNEHLGALLSVMMQHSRDIPILAGAKG